MYTLFRTLGAREALYRELAPFFMAFLVAELFYKFGSFTLECVAFVITWALISPIWSMVFGRWHDPS